MIKGIEKLAAGVIGIGAVVCAFTGREFYASAFGLGDRTRPIPKWFGRLWFIGIGLWFIAIAFGLPIPLVLQRALCIGLGSYAILISFIKVPSADANRNMILTVPKSKSGKYRFLIGMLVGIFFIAGGILLK
jgi:hypothetical protein